MISENLNIDPIDAMRMGVEYRLPVRVRNFSCLLRPLSITETVAVTTKVAERLIEMDEMARNAISENTLIAQETLLIAATDPDKPSWEPPLNRYMIGKLSNAELEFLFKQYVSIVDKTNPALEEIPVELIKEYVDRIKKKDIQPIDLSFSDLVNVVRFLLTNESSPVDK